MPRFLELLHKYLFLCVLTAAVLLFFPERSFGQLQIQGKVQGPDSKGIPYASLFLMNQGIGSASDSLGNFVIQLDNNSASFDTLVVSSLGYQTLKTPIWLHSQVPAQVVLSPISYKLNEVQINPEKYSAPELIKLAIKRTSKNYCRQSGIQQGFYRELLLENGIPLKINECAFAFQAEGYPQGKFNKKAFRFYWDDYFTSSKYKPARNISCFAQNWPVFTQRKDQVIIQSSRVSLNNGSSDGSIAKYGDPLGGPKDILNLDFVKYRLSFFDPKLMELYEFKLLDYAETAEGESLYVIQFAPSVQLKCYQHNWSKKIKVPLYQGRIWMSRDDYSILKFEAESVDWPKAVAGCHSEYPPSSYSPQQISFAVFYQKSAEGLVLDSISYSAIHQLKKGQPKVCEWTRTLSLNPPASTSIAEDLINQFPVTRESLRYRNVEYDSLFLAFI